MTELKSSPRPGTGAAAALRAARRALLESLPGRLLLFIIVFAMIAQLIIFLPLATAFRNNWIAERAQAAHIAALSADVAGGAAPSDAVVRQLLTGADAVAVARFTEGRNELVLYGGPVDGPLVTLDRRSANWAGDVAETAGTFFAPSGRYLRIIAEPRSAPGDVMDVIVPEAPLKRELAAYSAGLFWLSAFIAVVTGALIYVTLFYLFVRPMRKLTRAMARFQKDPENPARTIRPSGRSDEIGTAEIALAELQTDVRQALKQRERLASLGAAVAKINHDLRNVLASAQLVSDRLAASDEPATRKMGERLVRAIGRGIRLCEETLRFGRSEERPPEKRALSLRLSLEEAAADAMAAEGSAVWVNEVEADLTVQADPDQVHRIFLNLFRNALQAMDGLGEPGRLTVGARREGEAVRIEVADTGTGVPDKVREHLFEPFSGSARRDGTGLGLATARELARAHGGDVELVSTGPGGTVFAVRLEG
ncbi:HAMP domain-containing sensor histidine kinase [Hyphobacterium marinum]|uniref:histidine kinase n=1 Tax=Hyphobacterium marinum TaxID=3116574 RepID=A0ABU7LWB4_9PROT|nr:HAMP domain-containing sensor histidine kinase [Hyphobacterium sp. Y6023]MEE2565837.1 HAMP domain-containing sensor histidine kinase [Hyphobacterium sp. Y6023]